MKKLTKDQIVAIEQKHNVYIDPETQQYNVGGGYDAEYGWDHLPEGWMPKCAIYDENGQNTATEEDAQSLTTGQVEKMKEPSGGKHTPGPWTCEDRNDGAVIADMPYMFRTGRTVRALSTIGTECPSCEQWEKEQNANARLIAAAPELLEALEAAKCPCWVHNAGITDDIEALRKIALHYSGWNNTRRIEAIAKATGGE